jgi:hypothetical protein
MVPTEYVIVQFKYGTKQSSITSLFSSTAVIAHERIKGREYQYLVTMSSPETAMSLSREWCDLHFVRWAQVNWFRQARKKLLPNDPEFQYQWYLNNTGQGGSMTNRDVNAVQTWDITSGTTAVVIAILDDGVEIDHPDLAANVFSNTAETLNGVDDDANGYVDDLFGWDFVDNTNTVSPRAATDNHGTVSAGYACGVANNGEGIASLAYGCRLLAVRVASEAVEDIDWLNALDYAASFADVISIGYFIDPSPANLDGLRHALVSGRKGLGCVVVAALGNDGVLRRYASDGAAAPEVITVSATSNYDRKSWFADYGPAVDVVAPGGGGNLALISTDRVGSNGYDSTSYFLADGTSASAPITAGLAALLVGCHPDWSGLAVRRAIEASCDQIDRAAYPYDSRGWNSRYGFGRINAYKAMTATQQPWDIYEPDGDTNTATQIADGELQYRSLDTGDVDWVTFSVPNITHAFLSVLGTTNAYLRLYDEAGALIGTDDAGEPSFSHLSTNGLPSGTYYARVESQSGAPIPFYGLHLGILNAPDSYEGDDDTNSASTINPREMQYRTFYPAGDVDWATFDLAVPGRVDLWTMGDVDGDTVLFLRDAAGALVASNDDFSAYSWYSYLSTQLVAGTYFVEVREYADGTLPSYQLLLETYDQDPDDPLDTGTNTAVVINSGERVIHTLYDTNDVDWFTFELTNRSSVLLMTDTINPFLNHDSKDTLLTLYQDKGGLQAVATNEDGNNIYFSAIYRQGLESGRYYVEVRGQDLTNPCPDYLLALDTLAHRSDIENFTLSTNGSRIEWSGDSSLSYVIEDTSDLTVTQSWTVVTNIEGSIGTNWWQDSRPLVLPSGGSTQRFYRVRVGN